VLRATAGQTLTINLHTTLSGPVSFFAPGLRASATIGAAGMFTAEATVATPASYTFLNLKAGTYLYHSGTDITTQVPMGLYGALVVDVAPGQAYGDVSYAQDEVLVYSEIDPNLNANPAGFGGARVVNWNPQYFLINGKTHPGTGVVNVGTSQRTLLRFVNAGLQTFVPTFDGGLYMDLVAEDGNRYPQPFRQYGIELPAGKTIDTIITPGADGTYALYDRALHLTNGGLLTYFVAGPLPFAPTATADSYTVAEDNVGGLVVPAPGVLTNDLPPPPGLTAVLVTGNANGTLALAANGSFTYTPSANFSGNDQFTYLASNGTLASNAATVTITVTAVDDPPVANPDSATTLPTVPVTINVVANDTDPDGDLNSASANTACVSGNPVCSGPSNGTLLNNGNGAFTYTSTGTYTGPDSFVYEVCDTTAPTPLCDTATVNIQVVNNAPVANPDSASTPAEVPVTINVVANDTDADGNLAPATANTACATGTPVCSGPSHGTLVNNANGTFKYTSTGTYTGPDSFVYEVCDTLALCDTATVTITVVNSAPVAANDFAAVARNTTIIFSVTANDVDTDGTINVATVDLNPLVAGRQTTVTASRGGTVTVDALGNVTFVPKRGFRGTDTFTYTVQDNVGATSNVATLRVNVL
jgi:FtsP/CotA-like multicopper oxidase with cupredoxin domain